MEANINPSIRGLASVRCDPVGCSHVLEIWESGTSYSNGVSIYANREQLEHIALKLNTYLRSLDPPEAPLPDRDMTAPHEEPPTGSTQNHPVITREQHDRARARLRRNIGGLHPTDREDCIVCDIYERDNPKDAGILEITDE